MLVGHAMWWVTNWMILCLPVVPVSIILFYMKQVVAGLFILAIVSSSSAISIQEVIQLSKLNTSEELLIDLIHETKLDLPATPADIILLKEAGVTERVIQYLLKFSHPERTKLPESEGESVWISDHMRIYQTRDKNGRKIQVVTNLDEEGKRMGGEVPPEASKPEDRYPDYVPEEPREIYVTVRHEDSGNREYDSSDYGMPAFGVPGYGAPIYGGIPFYDAGYYPQTYLPPAHCNLRSPMSGNPNKPGWQFRAHPPRMRSSIPVAVRPAIRGSFAASRPPQIRH